MLCNVHDGDVCQGRTCIVHNPTDHHMSLWPMVWRNGRFERKCPHGTGHPDLDQFDYWAEVGAEAMGVHGCDGYCVP